MNKRKSLPLPPVHTGDELNVDDTYVRFEPTLPSMRFRRWVRSIGLLRLSRVLGIHRTTANAWLLQTRRRRVPSVDTAQRIMALSRFYPKPAGGQGRLGRPLRYEDIFGSVQAKEIK